MSHSGQKASGVGLTITAVVIAVGLICLVGVALLAALVFFGVAFPLRSQTVVVGGQTLPQPTPLAPAQPVYSDPAVPALSPYAPAPVRSIPVAKEVSVYCGSEGTLSLDGQEMELTELVDQLGEDSEWVVVNLTIHESVPYGQVADIQDGLQQAGYAVVCRVDRGDSVTVDE